MPSQHLRNCRPWKAPPCNLLILLPQFHCCVCCYMVWNIPLANSDPLSWLFLLPTSCPHPREHSMKKRKPRNRGSTVQQWPKHCCVTSAGLVAKSKTQQHTVCYEESELNSSQTQYTNFKSNLNPNRVGKALRLGEDKQNIPPPFQATQSASSFKLLSWFRPNWPMLR